MLLAKGTTAASLSSALQLELVLSWMLFRPTHGVPAALTVRGRSAAMAQEKKMVWCIMRILNDFSSWNSLAEQISIEIE